MKKLLLVVALASLQMQAMDSRSLIPTHPERVPVLGAVNFATLFLPFAAQRFIFDRASKNYETVVGQKPHLGNFHPPYDQTKKRFVNHALFKIAPVSVGAALPVAFLQASSLPADNMQKLFKPTLILAAAMAAGYGAGAAWGYITDKTKITDFNLKNHDPLVAQASVEENRKKVHASRYYKMVYYGSKISALTTALVGVPLATYFAYKSR